MSADQQERFGEGVDEFVISGASVDRIEFSLPRSFVATSGHHVNASLGGVKEAVTIGRRNGYSCARNPGVHDCAKRPYC
jgi:hypothetical protein